MGLRGWPVSVPPACPAINLRVSVRVDSSQQIGQREVADNTNIKICLWQNVIGRTDRGVSATSRSHPQGLDSTEIARLARGARAKR